VATVRTLIDRALRDDAGQLGYSLADIKAANERVRITTDREGRLVATIDGRVTYRTDPHYSGLWQSYHGDGDATQTDGHTSWEALTSWHQILGTAQISGRDQVRGWIVERLATRS